jgi:hypothetical protein
MIGSVIDFTLSGDQQAQLRAAHRRSLYKPEADRCKEVVLLTAGWSASDVAAALLVESEVRNHFKCRREGGGTGLLQRHQRGSNCKLSETRLKCLDRHIQESRAGYEGLFSHPALHRDKMRSLPTENFAIIGSWKRRKTDIS